MIIYSDQQIKTAVSCLLSEQQLDICRAVANTLDNLLIEAVAGSGKTYTLKAIMRMIKAFHPSAKILYLVFNKKNQLAAEAEIPANVASVKTFHSVGFTTFSRALPKGIRLNTDGNKTREIMDRLNVPFEVRSTVSKLVSMSKARAHKEPSRDQLLDIIDHYGLEADLLEMETDMTAEELLDLSILHCQDVLRASIKAAYLGQIDFDDMLYMPVIDSLCAANQSVKFDYVLVDEAQDTSAVRQELAEKLAKKGGRIIAVGDRFQAIYGFTGADNDALDKIRQQFSAKDLPLTVSYRCPKVIVQFARTFGVDHIQAAPNAPEGELLAMTLKTMLDGAFNPTDAIIARVNKILVEIYYSLMKRGIPCQILGKDIAAGLLKLVSKWKKIKTIGKLSEKLTLFRDEQMTKLLAKGKEAAAEALGDQIDCLLFLCDQMSVDASTADLQAKINGMFVDENGSLKEVLTLMSCHKSKGLEFYRVFWVGRSKYQPSKMARKDWQMKQEINLMYVAATRSKHTLVDVSI